MNVAPEFVRSTQDALRQLVDQIPLTEKLLSRPPFQYIRSIIANVVRSTGFMADTLNATDLHSTGIVDKSFKLLFLRKVIKAVEAVLGRQVEARPSKIISGLDPQITNKFLQDLTEAAVTFQRNRPKHASKSKAVESKTSSSNAEAKKSSKTVEMNGHLSSSKEKPARPQHRSSSKDKPTLSRNHSTINDKQQPKQDSRLKSKSVSKQPIQEKRISQKSSGKTPIISSKTGQAETKRKEQRLTSLKNQITTDVLPKQKISKEGSERMRNDSAVRSSVLEEENVDKKEESSSSRSTEIKALVQDESNEPTQNLKLTSAVEHPEYEKKQLHDTVNGESRDEFENIRQSFTNFSVSLQKRPPSRPSTARAAPPRVVPSTVEKSLPEARSPSTDAMVRSRMSGGSEPHEDDDADLWIEVKEAELLQPTIPIEPNTSGPLVRKMLETKQQLVQEVKDVAEPSLPTEMTTAAYVKQLTGDLMQTFSSNIRQLSATLEMLSRNVQTLAKEWKENSREIAKNEKQLQVLRSQEDPMLKEFNLKLEAIVKEAKNRQHIRNTLKRRLMQNEKQLQQLLQIR